MRKLPPLTALRAFEATARHMSFKAAAAELGLTPTAISHQIRLLEAICKQPLFRRRRRPVALTLAREKLFPVFRESFDAMSAVLSQVRGETDRRSLRVTTTNAFASRWLILRLSQWRSAHRRSSSKSSGPTNWSTFMLAKPMSPFPTPAEQGAFGS
jgi:LysR family glycine cleavage system transcriptional activator